MLYLDGYQWFSSQFDLITGSGDITVDKYIDGIYQIVQKSLQEYSILSVGIQNDQVYKLDVNDKF